MFLQQGHSKLLPAIDFEAPVACALVPILVDTDSRGRFCHRHRRWPLERRLLRRGFWFATGGWPFHWLALCFALCFGFCLRLAPWFCSSWGAFQTAFWRVLCAFDLWLRRCFAFSLGLLGCCWVARSLCARFFVRESIHRLQHHGAQLQESCHVRNAFESHNSVRAQLRNSINSACSARLRLRCTARSLRWAAGLWTFSPSPASALTLASQ